MLDGLAFIHHSRADNCSSKLKSNANNDDDADNDCRPRRRGLCNSEAVGYSREWPQGIWSISRSLHFENSLSGALMLLVLASVPARLLPAALVVDERARHAHLAASAKYTWTWGRRRRRELQFEMIIIGRWRLMASACLSFRRRRRRRYKTLVAVC